MHFPSILSCANPHIPPAGGECVECGFQQVSPPGSPDSRWCQCCAGYGGSDSCAQCPKGTFWSGPKDDAFEQDRSDGYGTSKSSSHTEAGIQSANQTARLQAKTAQYSSQSSSPPGVQPCISCSDIFGGGVDTLSVGASSMHECACLPGVCMCMFPSNSFNAVSTQRTDSGIILQ